MDEIEKWIKESEIVDCEHMRIIYNSNQCTFFIYNNGKRMTFGTAIDKETALTIIEILDAFVNDVETLDMTNTGVRLYG